MESLNWHLRLCTRRSSNGPEGTGPQVWVYSGEHGYSPGTPRIYVGTHPAYDGIGINFHNGRWLHIEHIWNGDFAPVQRDDEASQRRGAGDRLRPHKHADREIPLTFMRDGGTNNPEPPAGDHVPPGREPELESERPGQQMAEDVPRPPGQSRQPGRRSRPIGEAGARSRPQSGVQVKAEAGDLIAAAGAVARDAPRRNAGGNRRSSPRARRSRRPALPTTANQSKAHAAGTGSTNKKWVHASGGTYTAAPRRGPRLQGGRAPADGRQPAAHRSVRVRRGTAANPPAPWNLVPPTTSMASPTRGRSSTALAGGIASTAMPGGSMPAGGRWIDPLTPRPPSPRCGRGKGETSPTAARAFPTPTSS